MGNTPKALKALRRLVKAVNDASAARGRMTGDEARAIEEAEKVLETDGLEEMKGTLLNDLLRFR